MYTEKDLVEMKNLISNKFKLFEKTTQGVKQAIETVEINNQWNNNNYEQLTRILNRPSYKDLQNIEEDSLI